MTDLAIVHFNGLLMSALCRVVNSASADATDLLDKMLRFDPRERITATGSLNRFLFRLSLSSVCYRDNGMNLFLLRVVLSLVVLSNSWRGFF